MERGQERKLEEKLEETWKYPVSLKNFIVKESKGAEKEPREREGKPKTRISRNRSKSNMLMCCGNHLVEANTHSTGEGRFAGTPS